jgi:hypothetical protein
MSHQNEASARIDRVFLMKYAKFLSGTAKHEEYLYCGQKYVASWDEHWPLDEGWRVYKKNRID